MKKILTVLAVASALVLTGCSKIDTAATIGDVTISQTQAQGIITELMKARESVDTSQMQLQSGDQLNRSQLRFMIITTLFDDIAAELKLTVSKTELAAAKANLLASSGGESALAQNLVAAQIAPSNFDRYIRAVVISDKLNKALADSGIAGANDPNVKINQLVTAKAKQLKVYVNPRYGIWDEANADIQANDSAGSAVTNGTR